MDLLKLTLGSGCESIEHDVNDSVFFFIQRVFFCVKFMNAIHAANSVQVRHTCTAVESPSLALQTARVSYFKQ